MSTSGVKTYRKIDSNGLKIRGETTREHVGDGLTWYQLHDHRANSTAPTRVASLGGSLQTEGKTRV